MDGSHIRIYGTARLALRRELVFLKYAMREKVTHRHFEGAAEIMPSNANGIYVISRIIASLA